MIMRRIIRTPGDAARVVAEISRLDIARPIVVEVKRETRSTAANAYLWGALYPAIQRHIRESGGAMHSAEELHEFFKARLLPPSIVEVGEDQRVVPGSSARLSVPEFRDFVQQIEAYFVADLGGALPAHRSMAEWPSE